MTDEEQKVQDNERKRVANAISSMVHGQAVNSELVTNMRALAIKLADSYQMQQGCFVRHTFFESCDIEENPY